MGYTFAAALVKKNGTAPSTRKAIREGFERMGYRKAAPEEASLVLPMYHDKRSAWMTIGLEMPEDLGGQLEQLRQLAAKMHTPILYFMNFDSDFLYVAATDGEKVQHVHVGFIDEDDDDPENAEAMTNSDDLSVFDAILPDEAAREEFRRILAVDMMERVFSESAAQEMAALFGYTAEALFVDEDAEPFAVLGFDPPGQEAVPLMMPEDAPPAFALVCGGYGNSIGLSVKPCGGAGRGIRVLMMAEGYDAEDWRCACARLDNTLNENCGHPAPVEYEAKAVPRRVAFKDGGKGWKIEFPDAPIFRGINPDSPLARTKKAYDISSANEYRLCLTFTGGTFKDNELNRSEITHIWVIPMENPEGAIHHSSPRQKLRIIPYWVDADDTTE
ncbi:MAG: hypothetical protein IKK57_00530 [Clostridia bacterium]|nr:hypothetical protein [Clostridia bacterium]